MLKLCNDLLEVDSFIYLWQATSWKLEEAIQLFYLGNESGITTPSAQTEGWETDVPLVDPNVRYVGRVL